MQDKDAVGHICICTCICICKYTNNDMQDMDAMGEMREEQMDNSEWILTRQEWNWNKSGKKMEIEWKCISENEYRQDENGHGMDVNGKSGM